MFLSVTSIKLCPQVRIKKTKKASAPWGGGPGTGDRGYQMKRRLRNTELNVKQLWGRRTKNQVCALTWLCANAPGPGRPVCPQAEALPFPKFPDPRGFSGELAEGATSLRSCAGGRGAALLTTQLPPEAVAALPGPFSSSALQSPGQSLPTSHL